MLLNKKLTVLLLSSFIVTSNVSCAVTPEAAATAVQATIVKLEGFSTQITNLLGELTTYVETFEPSQLSTTKNLKAFKVAANLDAIDGLVADPAA